MTERANQYQLAAEPVTPAPPSFWQQLYKHRLAMISLLVAILSLGYNTWRNEATEAHRNTRAAAFAILQELGELQQISSYRHYFYSRVRDEDLPAQEDGDWVRGWGKVLLIGDLSSLMPASVAQAAAGLHASWQQHAAQLELGPARPDGRLAERAIMQSINATRRSVLDTLRALE